MPDLDFQITGVEAAARGLIPLMQFRITVKNSYAEMIHSVLLHTRRNMLSGEQLPKIC